MPPPWSQRSCERALHLLLRRLQRRLLAGRDRHAEHRPALGLALLRVAVLPRALDLGVHRGVGVRHAEVGRALEDVRVRRLARDLRDELDAGRAGPDHPDALAGDVDALVRPARGVVPLALEALQALDLRHLRRRQAAGGHDAPLRGRVSPRLGADRPAARRVVPDRLHDPRVELDVGPEVEAVGDVLQVAQDLRLGRVALAPRPLLLRAPRRTSRSTRGSRRRSAHPGSGSSTTCRRSRRPPPARPCAAPGCAAGAGRTAPRTRRRRPPRRTSCPLPRSSTGH